MTTSTTSPSGGTPAEQEAALAAARAQAQKDERERIAGIRDIGRRLRLDDALLTKHETDGTLLDKFRELALDEVAKRDATTIVDPSQHTPAAPRIGGRHKTVELKPGQMAARLVRLIAAAKGNHEDAIRKARMPAWDDGHTDMVIRALTAGIGAGGGFLIPEEYSAEVIELLRNRAVVRKLGARQIPMPGGNLTVPRLQGGASAQYVGEATANNASQESFGQIKLTEKKLMALVPVSNDLIKFASPQADQVVLDDMIAQMAVAEDAAFIRGSGTQFSPKGIRNWAVSGNVNASAGTSLANVTTDIQTMLDGLETNNVRMIQPGWIFNPRSANYIMLLQATTGQFVFRDEMQDGKLMSHPFEKTNNVPANLGSGSQTEIYLVDFADAVIGDVPGIEIEVSREAAYVDSTGTMQAAFSQDVTVIRTIERHDFALRHDVSAAITTGVSY